MNITIPIIRKQIRCPKQIQKLIFQLNYRGFYTGEITWGNPIEIEMESFDVFMKNVKIWRMSNKEAIRNLYQFMVKEMEFKTRIADPFVKGNRSDKDLLKISLMVPQSKIAELTQLFYLAHIKQ